MLWAMYSQHVPGSMLSAYREAAISSLLWVPVQKGPPKSDAHQTGEALPGWDRKKSVRWRGSSLLVWIQGGSLSYYHQEWSVAQAASQEAAQHLLWVLQRGLPLGWLLSPPAQSRLSLVAAHLTSEEQVYTEATQETKPPTLTNTCIVSSILHKRQFGHQTKGSAFVFVQTQLASLCFEAQKSQHKKRPEALFFAPKYMGESQQHQSVVGVLISKWSFCVCGEDLAFSILVTNEDTNTRRRYDDGNQRT